MKKIERAILSVSDKTGIVEFARGLQDYGIELLSTGGTARALRDAGLGVTDISQFTGFPEILDGRVKTLHPKVHAGLLYMRGDEAHEQTMQEQGLLPIDLVCVNLYPFEQTVSDPDVSFEDAVENIDIGGPTMLRSAAKNMKDVTVITYPSDYSRVLEAIGSNSGNTTEALRRELAQKVFARVAQYNAAIAEYMCRAVCGNKELDRPYVLSYERGRELRYGENPHQAAMLYADSAPGEACITHTEQLHGKEMSYNNYVDGDAALEAAKELHESAGAVVVKHTNPCGFATGERLAAALSAAWAGDPVSAFGSVIAVTRPVDIQTAEVLKGRFVEALIAPDFENDALKFLMEKSKNIRLLKLNQPMGAAGAGRMLRQIGGGLLTQDRDAGDDEQWMSPTSETFPEEKRGLALFGVKACKHVKSNAIVIVREYAPGQYSLLGMGAGQPNRVDAVRKLALTKARENLEILYQDCGSDESLADFQTRMLGDCVLVSDAFFPFPDNVHNAAEAGIRCIVQPGGSKRDEEVVSACDQLGVAMAFTGVRHFRH